MKLQTEILLNEEPYNQIDYTSKVLLFGSCFSENIGEKFKYFKFQSAQNPFGILFHPLAIENLITNAINEKVYTEEDIFFFNEQWHSYDAHSKLSSPSKETLLNELNKQVELTHTNITESSHIIITLGTAWVYRHIASDRIAANCHKVPQKQFLKELLTIDEVFNSLQAITTLVKSVNKDASIIFTVSPVRHLKDGFTNNTLSKAHLISAIHSFLAQPSVNKCKYFPSFEIMLDELRDYRFYAEDMLHPNQLAIDYIWEKFKSVWITKESFITLQEIEQIQKDLAHKPFNPNSEKHKQFLQKIAAKKKQLQQKFSHIQF